MSGPAAPAFAVVPGVQVAGHLRGQEQRITDLVEEAYRLHGAGETVNPPSYFLHPRNRNESRIIALLASVGGSIGVDGIKWISSFPANVDAGLPRASAVLILNDPQTGYPLACLESSIISAARTAASAALAADRLTRARGRRRPRTLGIVGAGLIARHVHTYLAGTGWTFDAIGVHDLSAGHAEGLAGALRRAAPDAEVRVHDDARSLIRAHDLVVFSTVAARPHVSDPRWFDHHPLVLHVSLRDLAPSVIGSAVNVVDDVEHCLRANTSVHLTERVTGGREFVAGTLYDVLTGALALPAERTVVFSPFGLGVLDLAVAKDVYDRVAARGELATVDGFFHDLSRHG